MTEQTFFTTDLYQFEDNFEKLKEMFVNKVHAFKLVEQQKIKLEENNNILFHTIKTLEESNGRLHEMNNKQQIMFYSLKQSFNTINLLKIELDKLKKENLKLKSYLGNNNVSYVQKSPSDKIENYNSLLQKKIVKLEKQLLQTQTLARQKSSLHCPMHEKEMSKLKAKVNGLYLENKSLKEYLTNFRTYHNQMVSEIRLNNLNNTNNGNQQDKNNPRCTSPTVIDCLDSSSHELLPIQVNIIDSD